MPSVNHVLGVYQELAEWYEQRGQAQMRDRFLVLAADAALAAGRADEAERLRARLLQQNPHHLLKPYPSLAEALKSPDVQSYVADLRRSYSPETAEHLLESLRADSGTRHPQSPARPPGSATPEAREKPEVLKFYRVQQEAEGAVPKPAPAHRPAQRPAPPASRSPASDIPPTMRSPASRPARSPSVSPFATEPLPAPPPRPPNGDRDEPDLEPGSWVSSGLLGLLVLAGVALAVYTFARPFLPAEWFPVR
jgi:hypothetical protein